MDAQSGCFLSFATVSSHLVQPHRPFLTIPPKILGRKTTRMLVVEEFSRYMPAIHCEVWMQKLEFCTRDGKVQCCHLASCWENICIPLHPSFFFSACSGMLLSRLAILDYYFFSPAASCFFSPLFVYLSVPLKQACLKMWFSVLSRDQLSHCWNIRPQSSALATVLSDVRAPPVSLTPSLVWTSYNLSWPSPSQKEKDERAGFALVCWCLFKSETIINTLRQLFRSCTKLIAYRRQSRFLFLKTFTRCMCI